MINKKIALLLMLSLGSRVTLFGANESNFITLFNQQVVAEKGSIEKIVKQEATGNTLLHHAVLHGSVENVKKVLNFKDCDSQCLLFVNKEGNSALHLAVVKGDVEIVKAILAHKDSGRTLLKQQNKQDKTALYLAVEKENLEIVKALLAQEAKKNTNWGTEVNTAAIKDKQAQTAVALAIKNKQTEILKVLKAHLNSQRELGYNAFKDKESTDLEAAIDLYLCPKKQSILTDPVSEKPAVQNDENDELQDMSELEKDARGTVVVHEAGNAEELKKAVEERNRELKAKDPNIDISVLSFNVDTYKQRTDENLKVAKKEEEKVVAKVAEEVKKAQEAIQGKEQSLLSAKHVIGGAGVLAVCYLMYSIAREVKKLEKQIQANPDLVSVALEAAEIEGLSTIDLIAIVLQNKWNQLVG